MIKPDLADAEEEAKEERKSSKAGRRGRGEETTEPSEIVVHDTRGQIWMDDREMA